MVSASKIYSALNKFLWLKKDGKRCERDPLILDKIKVIEHDRMTLRAWLLQFLSLDNLHHHSS